MSRSAPNHYPVPGLTRDLCANSTRPRLGGRGGEVCR